MFWLYWAIGMTIATFLGAYVVKKDRMLGYAVLTCMFAIYVVSANILVPRLVSINLGIGIYVLPTGCILWPFVAQAIDMVNEIYGKKKAYITVGLAYLLSMMMVCFVYLALQAAPLWEVAQESWWVSYFTATPRVLISSGIAFLIASFVDITLFDKLKKLFRKIEEKALPTKWLGLITIRSFTTDLVFMIVDTLIFITLTFVGLLSKDQLIALITGTTIAKVLLAFYDTPWFSAFRVLTKKVEREF